MARKRQPLTILGIPLQADDWSEIKALIYLAIALKIVGIDVDVEDLAKKFGRFVDHLRPLVLMFVCGPVFLQLYVPKVINEFGFVMGTEYGKWGQTAPFSARVAVSSGFVFAALWWWNSRGERVKKVKKAEGADIVTETLNRIGLNDDEIDLEIIEHTDDGMKFRLKMAGPVNVPNVIEQIRRRHPEARRFNHFPDEKKPDYYVIEMFNTPMPKLVLPEHAEPVDNVGTSDRHVFLGLNESGAPMFWDRVNYPHMMISGTTGSGKGRVFNSIITHAMIRGWDVTIIDPMAGLDYGWCAQNYALMGSYQGLPDDLIKIVATLKGVRVEAERRLRKLARYNDSCTSYRDHVENWNQYSERIDPEAVPHMITIDEMRVLLGQFGSGNEWPEKISMALRGQLLNDVTWFASAARKVGIHIAIGTQYGDIESIAGKSAGGGLKSNLSARVVAGVVDSSPMTLQLGLDVPRAPVYTGPAQKGQMYVRNINGSTHNPALVQGMLSSPSTVLKVWPNLEHVQSRTRPQRRATTDEITANMLEEISAKL